MRRVLPVILTLVAVLVMLLLTTLPALAVDPSSSVRIVKLAHDGTTVIQETTKTYEWMRDNLPVYGDGVTHYYHQGPVFDGDRWDPGETINLKDHGAVKGSSITDLCNLVGGMSAGDEVMIYAPDGYHTEYGYDNVYNQTDRQGTIVLCWYNAKEASSGEHWGTGYPGKGSFYTGMQIVFMTNTTNSEGKYVFGNSDMNETLPSLSQHFYAEGTNIYPSTNGLSVKWVSEVRIYTGGYTGEHGGPAKTLSGDNNDDDTSGKFPWVPVVAGVGGVVVVACPTIFFLRRRKVEKAG